MMTDSVPSLEGLQPTREHFIGIDSDGCVFDTMEIKHKECFAPLFIKHFRLQAVSKCAREVWEFVNLYSKTRGSNRFPALVRALQLVAVRPEVRARSVSAWDTRPLEDWIARESRLGNAALQREVANGNRALQGVLDWSVAVNHAIEERVSGVPPFPHFRECLLRMTERADVVVVSQTPTEALVREWTEHGLYSRVRFIAGQEQGTKAEHLRLATAGKYSPEKRLMIGDAPGDQKAAKANQALFYPIIPGAEEASWRLFHEEMLDRFLAGEYAGSCETERIREFEACLPEQPAWG